MKKLTLVILSQLLALNVFAGGSYSSKEGYVYSIHFSNSGTLLDAKNITFNNTQVQPLEYDLALAQQIGETKCRNKFTLVSIKKASIKNTTMYPYKPWSGIVVSGFCTMTPMRDALPYNSDPSI